MGKTICGTETIFGIYGIFNTGKQSVYIGSSNNIYKRWIEHRSLLNNNKHHCSHLQNAWNKYGGDAFEFRILESPNVSREELFECEQKWYDDYRDSGYEMYNAYDTVVFSGGVAANYDDLIDGKLIFNENQFKDMCWRLINTSQSFSKISKDTGINVSVIKAIYNKERYRKLTENMTFIKRSNIGENNAMSKLTEMDVLEIIHRLLDNEPIKFIAEDYNVSQGTINDIKFHRTWTGLTNGYVFINRRNMKGVRGRPVVELNYDLYVISEYVSAAEAARVLGLQDKGIQQVCSGKRRHIRGHIFMFKDEYDKLF